MTQVARSPKQLGNLIQRARRQKGLTQTELAGLSGLRKELISKIEGGHDGTKLSSIYTLFAALGLDLLVDRSEEHTSELQSLMRNSYAVFCLKNKTTQITTHYLETCMTHYAV